MSAKAKSIIKTDFTTVEPWRIFRIMGEFVEGFEILSRIGPAVSIFGSSKTHKNNKYYKLAYRTAYLLAKSGYTVITGGGGGIMEAANKGAKEAGGESVGLNIEIPVQQKPNDYITTLINFKYFFIRRVMFVKYAKAFIVFPGGFGTMDEFFEAITLIQTERIHKFPVILIDKEYWRDLIKWIKDIMLKYKYIEREHLSIFKVVDDYKKIPKTIKNFSSR